MSNVGLELMHDKLFWDRIAAIVIYKAKWHNG